MSVNADTREPSDADLITAVAAGDDDAYGLLWQRHSAAARRFAATLTRPGNVDDLVSEGFLRVLRAIKAGGGPDGAFRTYLFQAIRRFHIDTGRAYGQRVTLTGETEALDVPPAESAGDAFAVQAEHETARQAWQSLPEDSRTLLWHLIIEEETPAQIAPLLGVSANGVASRAVRARERLRQAFLVQHLARADDEECRTARAKLGGYVRDALSTRDRTAVEEHLRGCERCSAALAEITDVNHSMRAIIAPLLLGGSAVAAHYFATAPHAAAATASSARGMRLHAGRTSVKIGAAIGVAACAAGALAYALTAGGDSPAAEHPRPMMIATTSSAAPPPLTKIGTASRAPSAPSRAAPSSVAPTSAPAAAPAPASPTAAAVPLPATERTAAPGRPAAPSASPARHGRASTQSPSSAAHSPARTAARIAPSSAAPSSTAPSTSTPPSTPAPVDATVSIPLPGGPATVTAAAPGSWTITGWRADTADVTGGPTDAHDARWQVTGGSTLVVTATGPATPSASLVVQVGSAPPTSYPLN